MSINLADELVILLIFVKTSILLMQSQWEVSTYATGADHQGHQGLHKKAEGMCSGQWRTF